jgi:hypothetical protein
LQEVFLEAGVGRRFDAQPAREGDHNDLHLRETETYLSFYTSDSNVASMPTKRAMSISARVHTTAAICPLARLLRS